MGRGFALRLPRNFLSPLAKHCVLTSSLSPGSHAPSKPHSKLYQHRPQVAKTNFCVINVENCVKSARNSRLLDWMPLLRMGTQQWHHVHSPKVGRHPPFPSAAMAPSTGTTPPKLVVLRPATIAHFNGTLQ